MDPRAHLTSLDALETFRASLIVYLIKARQSLDAVRDDVRRTRLWIQHDRRMHWEGQVRLRRKQLDQAEQDLFSAKLSALRESTGAQKMAVHKAKRALEEAEEKLRNVKLWTRDFDGHLDPRAKKLEALRQVLDFELPKAITYLVEILRTLDSYAGTHPVAVSGETAVPLSPLPTTAPPHMKYPSSPDSAPAPAPILGAESVNQSDQI